VSPTRLDHRFSTTCQRLGDDIHQTPSSAWRRAERLAQVDARVFWRTATVAFEPNRSWGVLVSPTATLEILPKIDGLNAGATRHRLIHMLARVFDLIIASWYRSHYLCMRTDGHAPWSLQHNYNLI